MFDYTGRAVIMLQGSLFAAGSEVGPRPLGEPQRVELGNGAWLDLVPGWMRGADSLFEGLHDSVPWREERRWMYERMVDVPRLVSFYDEGDELPAPALQTALDALQDHYGTGGRPKPVTTGLCLYRTAGDSVAWHGDRIGRNSDGETLVAILSLGAARRLLLRPAGGGKSMQLRPGSGDLVVMGGTCQQTWEHCIPKSSRPVGPRMSVQFRSEGAG